MKLTYNDALIKLRQQAVNLLEGRHLETNGIPSRTKFTDDNDCYGCEHIYHTYGAAASDDCTKVSLEGLCPTANVVQKMYGLREKSWCTVNKESPTVLFTVIKTIDVMLEERK